MNDELFRKELNSTQNCKILLTSKKFYCQLKVLWLLEVSPPPPSGKRRPEATPCFASPWGGLTLSNSITLFILALPVYEL